MLRGWPMTCLACPKCSSPSSLEKPTYIESDDRLAYTCSVCGFKALVRCADDPGASWNRPNILKRAWRWVIP